MLSTALVHIRNKAHQQRFRQRFAFSKAILNVSLKNVYKDLFKSKGLSFDLCKQNTKVGATNKKKRRGRVQAKHIIPPTRDREGGAHRSKFQKFKKHPVFQRDHNPTPSTPFSAYNRFPFLYSHPLCPLCAEQLLSIIHPCGRTVSGSLQFTTARRPTTHTSSTDREKKAPGCQSCSAEQGPTPHARTSLTRPGPTGPVGTLPWPLSPTGFRWG